MENKYEIDINSPFEENVVGEEEKRREIEGIKSITYYIWFKTKKRRAIVKITPKLKEILRKSQIKEGFMLVSAMHITASVYVNDDEEGIMEDIIEVLDKLAPYRKDWRHHKTGEDNADAHLKSLILHHEVILPITDGDLDLGPWQEVFYAEFDGKRKKRVIVKIIGV